MIKNTSSLLHGLSEVAKKSIQLTNRERYESILRANAQKEIEKYEVWNRTTYPIANRDPKLYALDWFGNEIHYRDYGKKDSRFGWELDHIFAKALGGDDDISNLRALHWRANASLGGSLGAVLNN